MLFSDLYDFLFFAAFAQRKPKLKPCIKSYKWQMLLRRTWTTVHRTPDIDMHYQDLPRCIRALSLRRAQAFRKMFTEHREYCSFLPLTLAVTTSCFAANLCFFVVRLDIRRRRTKKQQQKKEETKFRKFVEPNFRINVLDLSAENVFSVCVLHGSEKWRKRRKF